MPDSKVDLCLSKKAIALELVSKELNHFGVIAGLFRQIGGHIELVSKELNHLAAILHVYAGGLKKMEIL